MTDNVTAYEYDDTVVEPKTETKSEETTETKTDETSTKTTEQTSHDEEDVNPAQARAAEGGWVPEDEWKGDPEDWVDYREFNIRGELMDRIKSQSSQMRTLMDKTSSLEEALQILGEQNKKTAKREYDRALKSLKAERREALEENDYDAIDEIEEHIDNLNEAKKELEGTPDKEDKKAETKGPTPEQQQLVRTWIDNPDNKWYTTDRALAAAADAYIWEYSQDHPTDLAGAMNYMEKQMKKRFPEDVGGKPAKRGSATTETDGRSQGKASQGREKKYSPKDLNDEQKRVGKTFIDQGVFDNMQEWVDTLVANGDLEA